MIALPHITAYPVWGDTGLWQRRSYAHMLVLAAALCSNMPGWMCLLCCCETCASRR
jgi:hypothetical protein